MVAPRYTGLFILGLTALSGCAGFQDTEYAVSNWARAECYWVGTGTFSERCQFSGDYAKGWKKGFYDAAMGKACHDPAVPPPCYWAAKYQSCEGRNAILDWYSGYRAGVTVARSKGYPSFHDVPVGLCAPVVNQSSCTTCASPDKCNCPAQPLTTFGDNFGTDATVLPNHAVLPFFSKDSGNDDRSRSVAAVSTPVVNQPSIAVRPEPSKGTNASTQPEVKGEIEVVQGPAAMEQEEAHEITEESTENDKPVLAELPPVKPIQEKLSDDSQELDDSDDTEEVTVLRNLPVVGGSSEVAQEPRADEVLVR